MRLPFQLAKRYLFGKKSTNAINIISGITIFGLTIGTAALVIILSVFNGFEGLLSGLFNAFNPDLELSPKVGKTMPVDESLLTNLGQSTDIEAYALCIEDLALFQYDDIQEIGTLKGVDVNYTAVTGLDTTLLYGTFTLEKGGIQRGVIGSGMRGKLGISINQSLQPLTVFTPLQKPKPGREFNRQEMYPTGVFSIQSDNDYQYVIASYGMASRLFEKPGEWSTIEIKIKADGDIDQVKKELTKQYPDIVVKTRYEQDEAYLNLLRIEKWIAFLIVSFTLILIAFNLIASLWMIVLEKKQDFATLRAMGYTRKQVFKTVLYSGLLMSGIGILLGFILSIGFYVIQKRIGILDMAEGFIVPSYPIELRMSDLIIVIITVMGIGLLGSLFPAKRASNISPNVRLEEN